MGLEPATPCLQGRRSTIELRQLPVPKGNLNTTGKFLYRTCQLAIEKKLKNFIAKKVPDLALCQKKP